MIADHLAQAERHVAEGQAHIKRQRELIVELQRDGHDTREAQRLLDLHRAGSGAHRRPRQAARRIGEGAIGKRFRCGS